MVEVVQNTPLHQIIEDDVETPGRKKHYVNIPPELIGASGENGAGRAIFAEQRVQNIITSQSHMIESVVRTGLGSTEDLLGYDLIVILKKTQPVGLVYIQVKASRQEVQDWNQYIKNKYFPGVKNNDQLVTEWRAMNRIIVINGAETKSRREILEDSFIPQLERIFQRSGGEKKAEDSGQIVLFPEPEFEQIQLFPEVA